MITCHKGSALDTIKSVEGSPVGWGREAGEENEATGCEASSTGCLLKTKSLQLKITLMTCLQ